MKRPRNRRTKLPDNWQVYSSANRKEKRTGALAWKYASWGLLLGGLGSAAIFMRPAENFTSPSPSVSLLSTAAQPAPPQSAIPAPAAAERGSEQRSESTVAIADGAPAEPVRIEERAPVAADRTFSFCHSGGGTNCVVDGDTIWLEGVKIRMADIDAPETHPPRCQTEAELGERATRRLHQLVNEGPFEIEAIGNRDADQYGRKLRVLIRNGRSLGDILVSEGLARTWTGRREPWC
jgi:endonuclease YncB( thermonuclease family)